MDSLYNYKEIGKTIRELRKSQGITQAELAKKIGKVESSITKYEKGEVEIPLKVLEKISIALDKPLEIIVPPKYDYSNTKSSQSCLEEYLYALGYDFRGISTTTNEGTWFSSRDDEGNCIWRDIREENFETYSVPYKSKQEAFQAIEAFTHFTLQQLIKNSNEF